MNPIKSELAQQLKEVLDQMSQEDFDKEWGEITDLNMDGVTLQEMNNLIEKQQEQ